MKKTKPIILLTPILWIVLLTFQSCMTDNSTKEYYNESIVWPEGQLLPHFATPARILDGLDIADKSLTQTERVLFSSLQGLVNKKRPRIFLFNEEQEGKYKWPTLLDLSISEYIIENRWRIVKKYEEELSGLILYNPDKSPHYRNIAASLAGLRNALPVTEKEMYDLYVRNITLPVIEDLSDLPYTTPEGIYTYFYNTYWPECNHRMILNLSPDITGYIRDYGVAVQSAIIYLNPAKQSEEAVLRMFFEDLKAEEGIVMGCWDEDNTRRHIATEYNLRTIPASYYENATVYSGMNHQVYLPAAPKKPVLENKIYLAIVINGDDNIQYHQHTMPELWDSEHRGSIPINWAVNLGLEDISPAILNYYYSTAGDNDFFVSAPSEKNYISGGIDDIYNRNKNIIASFDGSRPVFLTIQGEADKVNLKDIIKLKEKLDLLSPGNIAVCRGDHFLSLYNEANGEDFNLAQLHNIVVYSSPSFTPAYLVTDGSCGIGHTWISGEKEKQWLMFDFKNVYRISRYIIRHAESMGMDKDFNTRKFLVEASTDASGWHSLGLIKGNVKEITDISIEPVEARYMRLFIEDAGIDKRARICDMEIYGSAVKR